MSIINHIHPPQAKYFFQKKMVSKCATYIYIFIDYFKCCTKLILELLLYPNQSSDQLFEYNPAALKSILEYLTLDP